MSGPGVLHTVSRPGEAVFTIRGSRFIGSIEPVESVGAAEDAIEAVRSEHPDATHVVPAYRVRADPVREWCSDDGEPRGSAGSPVLNVLQGEELENVLVTVVRYYGGTNLGIGGLVRSYGEATKRAIDAAEVVTRPPLVRLRVDATYDHAGTVRSILESVEARFEAEYAESVKFDISVGLAEESDVRDRLLSATSGEIEIRSR